jgi:putative endonuclease
MEKVYYVYIMTNQKNGTIYIGISSNLLRRVYQHKNEYYEGFSKKHFLKRLVYYESFGDVELAIKKEKRLKKYNRDWKINLIEKTNPDWRDLWFDISQ